MTSSLFAGHSIDAVQTLTDSVRADIQRCSAEQVALQIQGLSKETLLALYLLLPHLAELRCEMNRAERQSRGSASDQH